MKRLKYIIFFCPVPITCCLLLFSCKEETVDFQSNDCKRQPAFIKTTGFDPSRSAFSTSEKKITGLVLLQLSQAGDTAGKKIYQHPSWTMGGRMGPIQLDADGNCFTAPVPVISLLDNPAEKQNIIYRTDAVSGEMKIFCSLPAAKNISAENPYGVLGLSYLCESNTLYASSVQGSTREKQEGVIYAIDGATGKILDKIDNADGIGMGISYMSGKRTLYFGSARSSDIFCVTLTAEGKFSGKPQPAFTIAGLGPRGDDKVRRIKFDKRSGQLQAIGVEFNFNLTAPTEKQEATYLFSWDEEQKKWLPAPVTCLPAIIFRMVSLYRCKPSNITIMYKKNTSLANTQDQDMYIDFDCEHEQSETIGSPSLFGPVACGVIFGYFLISNGTQYPFLIFGLAMLSYTLIRIFTKEAKANIIAIPATFLSAALTAGIGYFLYSMLS